MIKVSRAVFAHGYSGYDHLLDNDSLAGVVGRTFASLKHCAKALGKEINENPQDRRCAGSPVYVYWVQNDVEVGYLVWPEQ